MPKNCPNGKIESHACWECIYCQNGKCYCTALQIIKEEHENNKRFPAVEMAPVRHGEWEKVEEERFWISQMEESLMTGKPTKAIMPRCSCCKKVFGTIAFDFKYCPECGAKMNGGKNIDD